MNRYLINEYEVTSPFVSNKQTMAFCSDIHGETSKLEWIINTIKELRVTTFLLGGDIINSTKEYDRNNRTFELLQELAKTTQIFISIGNHDIMYYAKESKNRCNEIQSDNLSFLNDLSSSNNIHISNIPIEGPTVNKWSLNEEIDISSLNMPISYYWKYEPREEFEQFLNLIDSLDINTEKFNILLCHSPENLIKNKAINDYLGYLKQFNVILSGHMHGGLVPNCLRKSTYGGGFVGPYHTFFPEYAYGVLDNSINSAGVTKIASSVTNHKIIRNLIDFVYPSELEILNIMQEEENSISKTNTIILKK